MAEQTRQNVSQHSLDSLMEFNDQELRATMNEFLEEEKKANSNIWNFATITGIAMFFIGMVYLVQSIGLGIGPDLSGLMNVMPLIGGVLVTLVGFGFFVGDRRKVRKEKKKRRKREKNRKKFDFKDFDFENDEMEDFGLHNDLDEKDTFRARSRRKQYNFDTYALKQSRKLYKSRTDKKWAGVCGGLAKYFGISSTVIRLLFVITFFAGSGTSLLVYIALSIALDKEPPELMDDFEY